MTTVIGTSKLQVRPDVVACEISSGSALLNLKTSRYFKLNSTGAFLWSVLEAQPDQSIMLEQVCSALIKEYGIDHSECYDDVVLIFGQLEKAGLVAVQNP